MHKTEKISNNIRYNRKNIIKIYIAECEDF